MDTPEQLIERLQKATCPDSEIDSAITCWLFPDQAWPLLRNYTGSIDTALSLVPDGWTRAVDATCPEAGIDVEFFPPWDNVSVKGTHEIEAIATCISAIKARCAVSAA